MSFSFSGNELIDIAIGIERRGIAFYDVMVRSTDNPDARAIFNLLVGMERRHIEIFQNMLAEVDKYPPSAARSAEHADYLQSLFDNAVFTDDLITSELATQADSDVKALELAIGAEKDSILFYYEMRDIMPRLTHPILNQVIAEEKSHLAQLSGLKKTLEVP